MPQTKRKYNFSAGPATLPEPVLERARDELLDWRGKGLSVMEMSHRSAEFIAIAQAAEDSLRRLMAIGEEYAVLFIQGGASLQFAMVPNNLLGPTQVADYLHTGAWSEKAIAEARRFGQINLVASSEEDNFCSVPDPATWELSPDAAYFHYVGNETIGGVRVPFVPATEAPLVCDASSMILSEPMDVASYGVLYAGAQKNIGPAGLAIVIVQRDLMGAARRDNASLMDYATHADKGSMANTPACFVWYMAGLVFEWLEGLGGVEAMARINARKAGKLYAAIDASDFYSNPVVRECRSRMNVPFVLADAALDASFLEGAEAAGLCGLKGHRSVGGMRASLYNALPEVAVEALTAYMADFERHHT